MSLELINLLHRLKIFGETGRTVTESRDVFQDPTLCPGDRNCSEDQSSLTDGFLLAVSTSKLSGMIGLAANGGVPAAMLPRNELVAVDMSGRLREGNLKPDKDFPSVLLLIIKGLALWGQSITVHPLL